MPATLDSILAATRRRVARAKAEADVRQLERQAEMHIPRGFGKQLREAARSATAVIAELKPRRAFFTHLSHDMKHADIEATLPGHVRVSYDGLKLEVE